MAFEDKNFLLPNQVLQSATKEAPLGQSQICPRLLSEIEFISRFWKGGDKAYLIYLDTNLSSLPFLAKLFPCIKFHAYSSLEESSGNLIYHKEEFNLDLAKGWKNTRSLFPVYLVSYHEDLEEQKLWYLTIKANFSFLRLDSSVQKYLTGYIFVQPSKEKQVMLVAEEKEKLYKNLAQRINYYQQVTRKKEFNMEGETLSFDQAYEMQVLYDYINKTKGRRANLDEACALRNELV
ncbi:2'O methyltransferase [Cedratvirus kamchatka]|uniref:2'O methyltransferase n=1 Tax=Cedratvirus kamchatka TaxID=2716914 RepID=A0A6G8MXH8_9VIRU|nr:2'O methyltransferase [Cedratvirus kamchatka]